MFQQHGAYLSGIYHSHYLASVYVYGVGQKMRPLRLTARIFKITGTICMIFGTLQGSFMMNTSLNSVLKKFITQVCHLAIKITTWFFTCKIKRGHCIRTPTYLKYLHQFVRFLAHFNAVIFWTCLLTPISKHIPAAAAAAAVSWWHQPDVSFPRGYRPRLAAACMIKSPTTAMFVLLL